MRLKTLIVSLLLIGSSCATYYQSNYSFNKEFETGNLERALASLQTKSSQEKGKRQFLFDVNNGLVLSLLGRYDESNEYFEKAYLFGEDYRKNYLYEVGSYLTNPNFTPYRGEDHEHLILLYYKAINYLKMGKSDEALVECRRLNIRLQQLSDRYDSENKYRQDAFIHTLMGIIYETNKDYNNAFIAYRNAYNIYKTDYLKLFGVSVPQQLKLDILKTAYLSGLDEELDQFKQEFEMPGYDYVKNRGGELVFFWHNGLSPVKTEWGVNFVVSRQGSLLYFNNSDLGLSFPFNIESYSEQDKRGLANLEVFRVAFPRYVERPPYFQKATLESKDTVEQLQVLEDVNKIAFKCLQERMGLEFSKALIRVALKKLTEYEVRKSDRTLGSMIGIINAITERADTRNWQTLPYSISYCRLPLPAGTSEVRFKVENPKGGVVEHAFTYKVTEGQTLFHTFSSLESDYPNIGLY